MQARSPDANVGQDAADVADDMGRRAHYSGSSEDFVTYLFRFCAVFRGSPLSLSDRFTLTGYPILANRRPSSTEILTETIEIPQHLFYAV